MAWFYSATAAWNWSALYTQRRTPDDRDDRETRLSMLAATIIDNGDPDEIAAFAGELMAHASAELAGR